MHEQTNKWAKVKELRSKFISSNGIVSAYWDDEKTLEEYDATLAQRILWKWEFVFDQLEKLKWTSNASTLIDWGCGTGIATRGFLKRFGNQNLTTIHVYDHSSLAMRFAADKIKSEFTDLTVLGHLPPITGNEILLISHVMTELSDHDFEQLLKVIRQVKTVIWVDAGTPVVSRKLIEVREKLRSEFTVVSPCTHQGNCGLLGSAKDWCHFFAHAPVEAFTSSDWADFAETLGIHLDELPLSFLVMEKTTRLNQSKATRIIAKPEIYKGYSRLLGCNSDGVSWLRLTQRNFHSVYKSLKKGPVIDPVQIKVDGTEIIEWKNRE